MYNESAASVALVMRPVFKTSLNLKIEMGIGVWAFMIGGYNAIVVGIKIFKLLLWVWKYYRYLRWSIGMGKQNSMKN